MTGIEEFKNFFGGITILNVLEFGLAVAFLAFLYKKAKKYLIERHEAQVEKDQGLKKALEEVAKYRITASRASTSKTSWNQKLAN